MKQRLLLHKLSHTLRKRSADQEGFAILEAMIAAATFGIFMLAVIGMLMQTYKTNNVSRDVTEATAFAADQIETIQLKGYDNVDLQNNTYPSAQVDKYTVNVATNLDAVIDHTMTVTVTVSWQDKGRTRNVIINDILVDFI